jgi:hypothetical protein
MAVTDRRHLDDLAVDQLQPLVLAEDPELDHPLVLVGGESSGALDLDRHTQSPSRVYDCGRRSSAMLS